MLTVFLSLPIGARFRPAIMAIRLLKLPMLKHSRAVSIQYSIMRTRCFFLGYCEIQKGANFNYIMATPRLF